MEVVDKAKCRRCGTTDPLPMIKYDGYCESCFIQLYSPQRILEDFKVALDNLIGEWTDKYGKWFTRHDAINIMEQKMKELEGKENADRRTVPTLWVPILLEDPPSDVLSLEDPATQEIVENYRRSSLAIKEGDVIWLTDDMHRVKAIVGKDCANAKVYWSTLEPVEKRP